MKIVICSGKTGGHIFPALAVALQLKKRDSLNDLFFIGTRGGLDNKIIQNEGFSFKGISGCGFPAIFSWKFLFWGTSFLISLIQVLKIFRHEKPDVILSFGGYISCAPALVGQWLKIPLVIHEANVQLGRANRLLSRWAKTVCLSFPVHAEGKTDLSSSLKGLKKKIRITGLPIREKIVRVSRKDALDKLKLNMDRLTILVMGGSLGSQKINDCLIEALPGLKEIYNQIQIIHITGRRDYERIHQKVKPEEIYYQSFPFFDEIEYAFKCADFFIGRAGASTIAEITYCGLPSILIPYPYAVEGHQKANARYLEREGAAHVIDEDDLTSEVLSRTIIRLVRNVLERETLSHRSKELGIGDGASRIVQVMEDVLSGTSES